MGLTELVFVSSLVSLCGIRIRLLDLSYFLFLPIEEVTAQRTADISAEVLV